jgi:hypothetical protein
MWHAIYDTTTGKLESLGTVLADPLPEGLTAAAIGEQAPEGEWDASARAFVTRAAAQVWAPQDFMGRFTVAEETAIRARAMTDPNMLTFLARVERARSVSSAHPDTIAGLSYCVSIGVITAPRYQEILNG